MPYEVRLHCAPFEPTTVSGDERRVCIIAEHVIREMEAGGRFIVVKYIRSTPKLESYLEDVQRELERSPPPKRKYRHQTRFRPSMR